MKLFHRIRQLTQDVRPKSRLFSCSEFYEGVLGTSFEIHIRSTNESDCQIAIEQALERVDQLDAIFSTYRTDSEFMHWQQTHGLPLPVSSELLTVLKEAENYRALSRGAFCPIADALREAWQKGFPLRSGHLDPLWEVNDSTGCATRLTSLSANLNAIAKGYIVDQAAIAAKSVASIQEVLVNIGGDLRHIGRQPVQISVSDPRNDADNALPADVIQICNQAMATSGGYRRGFDQDQIHYSHVFDPIQGQPSSVDQSVSVVADSALEADALATIAGILPRNEWLEFIDSRQTVGVFIISSDQNPILTDYWRKLQVSRSDKL